MAPTGPAAPAAPHAPVELDDRERTLDPAIVIVWRVLGGLTLLPTLGILALVATLVLPGPRWLASVVALAILLLAVAWYPGARYRRWRWRLTDLGLELRHGVLVRRRATVPYFRIQQIDVAQGPLDRLVGLATLVVTTAAASGSASLPGIAASDAPSVRQALLTRAAAVLAAQPDDSRDAV